MMSLAPRNSAEAASSEDIQHLPFEKVMGELIVTSNTAMLSLTNSASKLDLSTRFVRTLVSKIGAINWTFGEVQKIIRWRSALERPKTVGLGLIPLNYVATTLNECRGVFANFEKSLLEETFEKERRSKLQDLEAKYSFGRKRRINASIRNLERLRTALTLILAVIQCDSEVDAQGQKKRLGTIIRALEKNTTRENPGSITERESKPDEPRTSPEGHSIESPNNSFQRLSDIEDVVGATLEISNRRSYHEKDFRRLSGTYSIPDLGTFAALNIYSGRPLYGEDTFTGIDALLVRLFPMTVGAPFVPENLILEVARRAITMVEVDFVLDNDEHAKSRVRYWVGILRKFMKARRSTRAVRRLIEGMGREFIRLIKLNHMKQARNFFRAGAEFVLCMVETEDQALTDIAIKTSITAVEDAMRTDYASHLTAGIVAIATKMDLGLTVWSMMEARTLAIAGLLFVQRAIGENKEQALNCMLDVIRNILSEIPDDRKDLIMDVFDWDWFSGLLEVGLRTVALLLEQRGTRETEATRREVAALIIHQFVRLTHSVGRLEQMLELVTDIATRQKDKITQDFNAGGQHEASTKIRGLKGVFELGRDYLRTLQEAYISTGINGNERSHGTGHIQDGLSKLIEQLYN
ncbi:hypothetical protein TWF730_003762 [Orbilia blumenaviensis]|uniref:Uncharacterized protein n=1 Tax=Orbilia blumenaviensis TaxID=1796055 RepID=A0AAV9U5Q7_9PEZI